MAVSSYRLSRRSLLAAGLVAARALGNDDKSGKGEAFESESTPYADAATESQVYRLTDPSYTSTLPAAYNRVISRNSGQMLFCCDRTGSPQAFRMNLKSGETYQLTDRKDVDGASLTLLPDSRSFCYFAERTLYLENLSTLKDRAIYTVPEGWERCPGLNIAADGAHAVLGEQRGDGSRLRSVSLMQGAARTILETPFPLSDPMERPLRAQILYRENGKGL